MNFPLFILINELSLIYTIDFHLYVPWASIYKHYQFKFHSYSRITKIIHLLPNSTTPIINHTNHGSFRKRNGRQVHEGSLRYLNRRLWQLTLILNRLLLRPQTKNQLTNHLHESLHHQKHHLIRTQSQSQQINQQCRKVRRLNQVNETS